MFNNAIVKLTVTFSYANQPFKGFNLDLDITAVGGLVLDSFT